MKDYDYNAISYKERLATLCGIALNQYNVIHIDIQQFVSKYPVIKDMVARLTKELLFDVKMEMPDVTLFDDTDLVRTSKDIFSQKREKFIFIIDEWDSIFRVHRDNGALTDKYRANIQFSLIFIQPLATLVFLSGPIVVPFSGREVNTIAYILTGIYRGNHHPFATHELVLGSRVPSNHVIREFQYHRTSHRYTGRMRLMTIGIGVRVQTHLQL